MNRAAVLCTLALGVMNANGAIGVVESTGQFVINATTSYYSPVAGGAGAGNSPIPADLGTFSPTTGDSLGIDNWFFENFAYNSGGGDTQFENNWLDGSNTATLLILVDGNSLGTFSLSQTGVSGNNRNWALNPGSTIDLLAGLSNGSHTVEVSVDYTYNWWDGSNTQVGTSTNNGYSSSTFTVVPEPTVALLGGLGLLGLLRRRR